MPNKKNTPGCPCCTPAGCDVTFVITACCGPAVGATVTVKDGSGTTKGTGTTNSSGSVTISLAGTSGQTLYVTVSYDATEYDQYTSVLLGAHCGRTYAYTLTPKTETYGGTPCGSITLSTVGCNGTTVLGGKSWTLQKASAGGYFTYATGTTDATTGKSTITGATYGGAFDGYRFLVTDATGTITGTAFTLTSSNCAASVVMRMSTVAGSPCSTPNDAVTLSGGSTGLTSQRVCCASCGASNIPAVLTVVGFPSTIAYIPTKYIGLGYSYGPWTFLGGCSPLTINKGTGQWSPCQSTIWQPNIFSSGYPCTGLITQQMAYYVADGGYPWYSYPTLSCWSDYYNLNGKTKGFYLNITYQAIGCFAQCGPYGSTGPFWGATVSVKASSVTCSPFSATFNIPDVGFSDFVSNCGWPNTFCSSIPAVLFPATTVTIHE